MSDTARITTQGRFVIPLRIRRKYGIEPGTRVSSIERDKEIIFQPVTREYIKGIRGMFKEGQSLTKAPLETRAEEKAREDRKIGECGSR